LTVTGWIFSGWPRISFYNFLFPPEIQQVWAAQFARPDSDISLSGWTDPSYSKINEVTTDDDTSYTEKTGLGTLEVGLSDITDPNSSAGHVIRSRVKQQTGSAGPEYMTCELYQGAILIASYTSAKLARGAYTSLEYTLTALEADSITNYNDLRFRFTSDQGASEVVRLSWAEFEVPDFVNVSVSVSDGTVAYGTLGQNSTADTNPDDTQTATNNGNVTEDFNIKATADASTPNWTIGATAAPNVYVHQFCISTCGTPPTNYTPLTTSYQTLATGIAAEGNQTFDLYINTPNTSTVYTVQSVDVIVQAIAG